VAAVTVSRGNAARHMDAVLAILEQAETDLAQILYGALRRAEIPADLVAVESYLQRGDTLRELSAATRAILDKAIGDATALIPGALQDATDAGDLAALRALPARLRDGARPLSLINVRAIEALAAEVVTPLRDARTAALRGTVDAYRAATARAVASTVTGVLTDRQAADVVAKTLQRRSITGFTDRAGRQWGLVAYARMATRTAAARAYTTAALDRWTERGVTLVKVNYATLACSRCAPWEGRVLTTGNDPGYPSLDEAVSAGLFHPNCRHAITAHIPLRD
jgi:hypothetical protein